MHCVDNATWIGRDVVVNFDLGERFPRPRSQQRGSLRPRAQRVAMLGVGAGGGRPLPLRESRGITPGNFFEIFHAKSRVWGQFRSENKPIDGQPNEYHVICRKDSVLAFHLWPTIFVPAPKYFPERRSAAFPPHYTPVDRSATNRQNT